MNETERTVRDESGDDRRSRTYKDSPEEKQDQDNKGKDK